MFTVDKEGESTIVTSLDNSGFCEDLQVIVDPELIWVRQWDEHSQEHQVMIIQHQQLNDVITAIEKLTVGNQSYENPRFYTQGPR
jgi:hypothetical protein